MMLRLRDFCDAHWRWLLWIVLPALSLLMHLHLLQRPLQGVHAWRQCETASNVHFFAEGESILHPRVFSLEWEDGYKTMEFPLMQWVMGQVAHLVGDELLAMRLLSWAICILGMLGLYRLVWFMLRERWIALLTAWAWLHSPEIFYYAINPLPDNLALAATLWGLAFFMEWHRTESVRALWFSMLMIGLATAVKLPFVLFMAVPGGASLRLLFRTKGKKREQVGAIYFAGALALLPAGYWYYRAIPTWTGNGVVKGVLDMGMNDLPDLFHWLSYNLYSTLPELLLNYALVPVFLLGIYRIFQQKGYLKSLAWPFGALALATLAYYLFEINMITTVHDYYLFPFMPSLFLIVAIGMRQVWSMAHRPWVQWVWLVLMLVLPVTAGLRAYERWEPKGMPEGLLTHTEELRAAVPADARIIFADDLSPHISLYHLRHFGWTFDQRTLEPTKFEQWIANGATYIYTTDKDIVDDPPISAYLEAPVAEYGGIYVWKLNSEPRR